MTTLFYFCALVGGALLVVQLLLLLLGGDSGHGDTGLGDTGLGDTGLGDTGLDAGDAALEVPDAGDAAPHAVGHSAGAFLKLLSLQALTAFATFFGLGGMYFAAREHGPTTATAGAVAAGALAMLGVAKAMQWMTRLDSSGTLDLRNAIGCDARVYLRVPAAGEGTGRIHVAIQGRTVELKARSRDFELPTGSQARIVDLAGDDTVVVAAAQPAAPGRTA